MGWTRSQQAYRTRSRARAFPPAVESLEPRELLADGITPSGGSPITAAPGVAIANAVFASYVVSDSSGQPGTQFRAKISFGDGQVDKKVVPVQSGSGFQFVDTHTYQTAGTFTVTVMIAVPGSHRPNDNVVTTPVVVGGSTPTPPPTPTPPLPSRSRRCRHRSAGLASRGRRFRRRYSKRTSATSATSTSRIASRAISTPLSTGVTGLRKNRPTSLIEVADNTGSIASIAM